MRDQRITFTSLPIRFILYKMGKVLAILLLFGLNQAWAAAEVGVPLCNDAYPSCPLNVADWLNIRQVEADTSGTYCGYGFYRRCFEKLPASVVACFAPLVDQKEFEYKEKNPKGMSAARLDYDEYYSKEPVKSLTDVSAIPEPLKDKTFLAMIKNPRTMTDAITEFKKKNPTYTVVRYSGNAKNIDTEKQKPEDRLLIVVPGEKVERWLQFSVPTLAEEKTAASEPMPDVNKPNFKNETDYAQFSQVVVDKSNVKSPTDRPAVYFRDFWRQGTQHGIEVGYSTAPNDSCLKCHYNGVNPIYPFPDRTTAEDQKILEKLNGKIVEYGMPSNPDGRYATSKKLNMSIDGPAIGPVNPPSRTDEFMAQCAPGIGSERRAELKKMMNCSSCHNGKSLNGAFDKDIPNLKTAFSYGVYELAPIYYSTASELEKIIVEHNAMPLGATATTEERKALFKCLIEENSIVKKEVMSTYDCEAKSNQEILSSQKILKGDPKINESSHPSTKVVNTPGGSVQNGAPAGIAK